MIGRVALHEFRYQLGSIPSLILAGVFFAVAFLVTANGSEFQFSARGGQVFVNSPYAITGFLVYLNLIAIFFLPSLIGGSVLKDAESRFDAILFATPISKKSYVLGRFAGAFLALLVVLSAAPIGLYVGTFWPWAATETLGVNHPSHYILVFFGVIAPSMFTASALVFAAAIITRSMMWSNLAALALLLLYIAVVSSSSVPTLWDPLMVDVVTEQSRYWTAAERNTRLIEFSGMVLANRLLWVGIAITVLAAAYRKFSFRAAVRVRGPQPAKQKVESLRRQIDTPPTRMAPMWTHATAWEQLKLRTRFEVASVARSAPFIVLMCLSLTLLLSLLIGRDTLYDVSTYPLTRLMLEAIQSGLKLALMAVLAFYSGEIIWRERSCGFSDVIDATPAPNWVFVVSKLAAVVLVMLAIVVLGIVMAITLQLLSGYTDLQLGRYLWRGLLFYTLPYLYLAVLASFLQVVAGNRMLGILLFIGFIVLLALSHDIFGIDHMLLSYGLPGIAAPMSDMNGDAQFAVAGVWARLYWGSMAAMLLILTRALWQRGTPQPLRTRLRALRVPRSRGAVIATTLAMTAFIGSGLVILYNTNVLNTYLSDNDLDELRLGYEQRYRQFENLPMPHIVDVQMDVDIFPDRRRIETRSIQMLENKTDQAISTIHLTFPVAVEVARAELQGAVLNSADPVLHYYVFDLTSPMLPGEQRQLSFETVLQHRGFTHTDPDTRLVDNGTFIRNTQLTPFVGFCACLMISDERARREHGLEPLPRLPALEDRDARNRNFIRTDSDYIDFTTTVSTVAGQTAIAPGTLVKDWMDGDRHYFRYQPERPMMNSYAYLSADYAVAHDEWNDVEISVFHDAKHGFNVDRMIAGVKDSLDYYSKEFSPYPHHQVRIAEFPAYEAFAQAFPTTIPFSEGIGFIADLRDPQELDLPYFVTAHEMAHQWWAHQVMSAHTQGGTMLLETLAQYSALMVMEHHYGRDHIRTFLKLELDRYLSGRANEVEGELPINRVEDQPYIHYRKGAMVMYALKDQLGEETVNRALRRLLHEFAYRSAPYPTSSDLIGYLKDEAGPEHVGLIVDLLEKISLYDVKVNAASMVALPDGRYRISLGVEALKSYADAAGEESIATFDIPVDIGLFLKRPSDPDFQASDALLLEKHRVSNGQSTLELVVDQKPAFAGIDPYVTLIDRDSEDNVAAITWNE